MSYFFRGGSGGPAGECRGGWRGTSEAYFWRGAVFWRVGWPGNQFRESLRELLRE